MGVTIAFVNQKGGVGKTTSAINVAASLGLSGKRALLCDLDPQSNATAGVGIGRKGVKASIYDVIIGRARAEDAVIKTKFENLWAIPSNIGLAGIDIEMAFENPSERSFLLKNKLAGVKGEYDYIIFDCPPSLGLMTLNALCAADAFVVVMQCEYFALEGLTALSSTVGSVKRLFNDKLELAGLLITMYDGRLNLSAQVMDELKRYYPGRIFKTTVPRTVRLSEAPSHGMPIYYYDKNARAADSYLSLAAEIIEYFAPYGGK